MRVRQRAKQRGVELPLVISDHCDWGELNSSILESGAGSTIVFTVAAFATALALLVLTFLYRPYALAVNGAAAWVSQDRRYLGGFLASIVLLPALLLAF